ncbi:DUF2878 family protein [Paraferrimonas sedimenticola]|uniref:DUF2878 domain-containing protein n=1 Tax=Paraferrimonas sedimenticola TaxID=375674 RepID=A0AA37RZ60_9GAMM|nr:DUF2878 family protein [Paraferrimonas sedimenticola]GLP98059.1 hypothetical protein GCM10007895_33660 [Paraferrimonas sedimenticola]
MLENDSGYVRANPKIYLSGVTLAWALATLLGPASTWFIATLLLLLIFDVARRKDQEHLVIAAGYACIGTTLDATLAKVGLLKFDYSPMPVYLMLFWLLLAICLPFVIAKMGKLFGLSLTIVAPLSYWYAVSAGYFSFGVESLTAVGILALCWFAFGQLCQQILIRLKNPHV